MGYSKQAAIGVSWMGALKVFIRVIGFIRLFILARLLLPADFGLFGIAALVLAFLEIFTETGINVFLIQNEDKNVLKKYINTAWVVSIFRGILMFVLIFLLAGPISQFFNAPKSKNLIVLISFVPLIKGFINPAIVSFRKDLVFGKEFAFRAILIIFDSLASIGYAIYTQSADSLAIGIIASALLEALFSFLFISPRPKFKFEIKKLKKIINNGKWITLNGIWGYISQQGDDAVVGKILNTTQLGFYQIAYKFSLMPVTEISTTIHQVAFPVYAKIAGDKTRLRRAYFKVLSLVALLSIPMGTVLFMFSEQIIFYTIGENWLPAAPALKVLAIYGTLNAMNSSFNILFFAVKKQDLASKLNFIKALTLIIFVIPLTMSIGIQGAAYAVLISLLVIIPPTVFYVRKVLYDK